MFPKDLHDGAKPAWYEIYVQTSPPLMMLTVHT